ncbi:MAG: 2-C-methyl-D-erythritol 2,4-cyclodiphosphate synthase [Firmicutes bacterium]|nr:2-C-methyl-D-erythritol 2,4-cyclodiphosphate synthase [Bacillota bacterium]
MRIGQGFDVHRLVPGRRLVLGGVEIPYELGLLGHSDADVLLHAVMDALLGAIGAGDIGGYFPDHDPIYKDSDSALLLKQVLAMVKEKGFRIENIDVTVIAERPKLASHIPGMKGRIAELAGIEISQVNIKATTTEGLGFTGRGEGIAALAVVLLERIKE